MEILLATNNRHKQDELAVLMPEVKLITPKELGIEWSCREEGNSYLDNALIKASTLYRLTKRAVLADDSGLAVDALGGSPGIHSARYGSDRFGRQPTAEEQIRLLLEEMFDRKERAASFVCCLVLITGEFRFSSVQETLKGEIAENPSGENGFGYDPIFQLPNGRAFAELTSEEKNAISHRGLAAKKMSALLRSTKEGV